MNSERIGLLLRQLPELQGLTRQVRRLSALQATLADALPANLAASVALAVSESGELVLYADNGAVATKLKHLAPRILVFLRQRGIEVTGIRVQMQVSIRHNPLPQKQISLSLAGRTALRELAERVDNSPLKLALERLSRRGIPSDSDE
ncbi:MAG TPA: DciA family protein [Burkholderiales bacterium]